MSAAVGDMRIVRMLRDMRPWRAGQDAAVPEKLAHELVETGDAEDVRPYPPPDVAPAAPVAGDDRPVTLRRPRPYFTRKRG